MAAECNECNEALEAVRSVLTSARRLALVAENALINGDFPRARAVLHDLHDAVAASRSSTEGPASPAPSSRSPDNDVVFFAWFIGQSNEESNG